MPDAAAEFAAVIAELEAAFGRMPDDKKVMYYGALKGWPLDILRRAVLATVKEFEPTNRVPFPYPRFVASLCEQISATSRSANLDDLDRQPRCQSCDGTGYVLVKGLWSPEDGWGRDAAKVCYCETGAIHERSWQKDMKERGCLRPVPVARPGEAGENERAWAESVARFLAHRRVIGPPPADAVHLLDDLPEPKEESNEADPPF